MIHYIDWTDVELWRLIARMDKAQGRYMQHWPIVIPEAQ